MKNILVEPVRIELHSFGFSVQRAHQLRQSSIWNLQESNLYFQLHYCAPTSYTKIPMWEWQDSNLLSHRHLIYSQAQLSNSGVFPFAGDASPADKIQKTLSSQTESSSTIYLLFYVIKLLILKTNPIFTDQISYYKLKNYTL